MKDTLIGFLIYFIFTFGVLYIDSHRRDGNWFGGSPKFGPFRCSKDLSGHVAGYKWAEAHQVSSTRGCPHGNSRSFYEGCLVYIHESDNPPDDYDYPE